MTFLTRVEMLAATEHRLRLLEGFIAASAFPIDSIRTSSAIPSHVA
jgi:hypothetical protein